MNSWCSVSKLCDVISIQNLFWKVQCIFLKIFKYISAISVFLFFLLHFLYLLLFFTMRLLVIVEELCLEMFYIYIYIYIYVCVCVCVCVCVVPSKVPRLFCTDIWNCRRHLNIQHLIAIHLIRWLTNFYDFRFKWTATAAIGIHPKKA